MSPVGLQTERDATTLRNAGKAIRAATVPDMSASSDPPVRHRDWPGFVNARTLEGLPTTSGPIGPGRLFRSDEPTGDTDTTVNVLALEGIRRVIDLRSAHETERRPSALADKNSYRIAPLVDPRMDHLRDPSSERSLADLYAGSLDRNGRTIVDGIRHIVDAPEGGVLVHCAAGKDRTGILVAVILAVLGAPSTAIVDDYAETEARLAPYFAEELASIDDPERREQVASRQRSAPETMAALLEHLDLRHGGGPAYVKDRGMTDADISRLAERLTG